MTLTDKFYTGTPKATYPDRPVTLPLPRRPQLDEPEGYVADKGLVDAVHVALTLGQPLLLTGDAGTGKTQLAYSLAKELGMFPPLKFETKSSSTSRDLFYTFDITKRFHAVYSNGSTDNRDYITYNALGIALLRACPLPEVDNYLTKDFVHKGPRQQVVLIDEIDKAPRDFPNDILNEIDEYYFRVPELGNEPIKPKDKTLRPILVLTSNSEKHLPEPFLRRCVFYHIPFPKRETLKEIIAQRAGEVVGLDRRKKEKERPESALLKDALDFFELLGAPASGLRKKPATAELLSWLLMLNSLGATPETSLRADPERKLVDDSLSALVKSIEDQGQARVLLKAWK
jgi:MoxR-like ATPase